jgi:hypothetical protein
MALAADPLLVAVELESRGQMLDTTVRNVVLGAVALYANCSIARLVRSATEATFVRNGKLARRLLGTSRNNWQTAGVGDG